MFLKVLIGTSQSALSWRSAKTPKWRKLATSSGGVFEPHTIHMPQLHSTCFQSGLDIDSHDSHPSCVAQPIHKCQEQSCAQDTVQIQGKHGSGALLSPFLFLVGGAPATERVSCLFSGRVWSSLVVTWKVTSCLWTSVELVGCCDCSYLSLTSRGQRSA